MAHIFDARIDELLAHPGGGGSYTDFDGSRAYFDPTPEAMDAYAEAERLHDLRQLRNPVGLDTALDHGPGWGFVMAQGLCPCPGVPRRMWDPESELDAMGLHMGRNA